MSTELVEKEIARFLASSEAEVLCLRGKWGIGKTYSWTAFLRQAQREKRVLLKTYSYVSLFGIDTLDQLKYAIFENSVGTDVIGVEPSLETLQSNTTSVTKQLGRRSWSIVQHLPKVKDFAAAVQSLSFLSVRNAIVCIDDLERKGAHLSTRDVLGLISHLKEQKKCKVVLILNQDELDAKDKDEFTKYNEKVLDVSLEFDPSPRDSARIAITGKTKGHNQTAANVVALGISNIRIIKKIERLVLRVEPILAEFREPVFKQAAQSIALLAWAVHTANVALLGFVEKKRGRGWYGTTKPDDLTDEEKTWDALLDRYDYSRMDEFDLLLLHGIQRGFFDEAMLKEAAAALDAQFKANEGERSLEAGWRLYHDSFDENEEAIITAMEAFFEHTQLVTQTNFNGLVSLLKDLGYDDGAKAAIEHYMEARKDEQKDFFDVSEIPFAENITDEDIQKAFAAKLETFKDDRSPADVLTQIATQGGTNRADMGLLSQMTVDEFEKLFKSKRGAELREIVRTALGFGRIENATDEMKKVSSAAEEALRRIGRSSRLNRRRVTRKYGVTLDEADN